MACICLMSMLMNTHATLRLIGEAARKLSHLFGSNCPARRFSPAWFGLEPLEPRILLSTSLPGAALLDSSYLGSHAIIAHDWDRISAKGEEVRRNSIPTPALAHVATSAPTSDVSFRLDQSVFTKGSLLETSEAGGQATFSVVLDSQPLDDVVIPITVSDASEGEVSAAELVFTPENWDTPQTVTVTGVDDEEVDRDVSYLIVIGPAVSHDPTYDGLDAADVKVINLDNDTVFHGPALTISSPALVFPSSSPIHPPQGPPAAPVVVLAPSASPRNQDIAGSQNASTVIVPPLVAPSTWESPLGDAAFGGGSREGDPAETVAEEIVPGVSEAEPALEPIDPNPMSVRELPVEPSVVSLVVQPQDTQAPTTPSEPMRPLGVVSGPMQVASLNLLAQQFEQAGRSWSASESLAVSTVTGTTVAFSVGYLLWAVRGGSLLTSLLCTIPVWRLVDPIPILEFARRKTNRNHPARQASSDHADRQTDMLFE